MFRSSSTFDKLLDRATSNLRLEPDWPAIIQICDLIRQGDVPAKYALAAFKKKIYHANPHVAMFGLQVLESVVKNCGSLVHDEVGTKVYMEQLRDIVKSTTHENVRNKALELVQAWAYAFRNSAKYRAVQDTVNIMKTEGYQFPALKESDAMFSADTAPEWAEGECCHRCRVQFSMMQRKHHCRACGQVFCHQCSSKTSTLPKFGIEKEVRVCEACFDKFNKPAATVPSKHDTDLPPEYLSSSLAQQTQTPPRKTEEELREEEEFQLALALSKSEAEEKEKEKLRATSSILSAASRSKQQSPPTRLPIQEDPVPEADSELARYLNRSYWEQRQEPATGSSLTSQPSAPSNTNPVCSPLLQSPRKLENGGETSAEMEEFVTALKSQVEIFVNRMKSNSSRGRSIANDSSVQTLFMNITSMHSQLLRYIQDTDERRLRYEGLQDKLAQVRDARAALDALREEHREKMRRQAEEIERQRQIQMAQKLDMMRKKKQEYLQYQRQLALQRIQEQEREMQLRQEQQKQHYLMGGTYPGAYMPGPQSGQYGPEGGPPGQYPSMPMMPPQYTPQAQYQPEFQQYMPPGPRGPPQQPGNMMMGPGQMPPQMPPNGAPGPMQGQMPPIGAPGPMQGQMSQPGAPGPMQGQMPPPGAPGPMQGQMPQPGAPVPMPGQMPQGPGPMPGQMSQGPGPMPGQIPQGPGPMQGQIPQGGAPGQITPNGTMPGQIGQAPGLQMHPQAGMQMPGQQPSMVQQGQMMPMMQQPQHFPPPPAMQQQPQLEHQQNQMITAQTAELISFD